MTIKNKLILGFSLILILMAVALTVSITILHKQSLEMNEKVHLYFEKNQLVNRIDAEHAAIGIKLQGILLDPTSLEREAADIEESHHNTFLALETLSDMIMSQEERVLLTTMKLYAQLCDQNIKELYALLENGDRDKAIKVYLTDHVNMRVKYSDLSAAFGELQKKYMTEAQNETYRNYKFTVILIYSFLVLALIVGIAVTLWIVRDFSTSMSRVLKVIKGVSEEGSRGLKRIEVVSKDEIGTISSAYNLMVETIERQSEREAEYVKTLENQNWIEKNLNEFASLFHEVMDFPSLGKAIVLSLPH